MQKLSEVETAKMLMTEAVTWSVMKWLREKKAVRKSADQANAALDHLNQAIKQLWPETFRAAYEALTAPAPGKNNGNNQHKPLSQAIDSEVRLTVKKIKEADDEAYRARMDAEDTFDQAEKQLSTSLARDGCRKAILSWDLHEKAIRKAEAVLVVK